MILTDFPVEILFDILILVKLNNFIEICALFWTSPLVRQKLDVILLKYPTIIYQHVDKNLDTQFAGYLRKFITTDYSGYNNIFLQKIKFQNLKHLTYTPYILQDHIAIDNHVFELKKLVSLETTCFVDVKDLLQLPNLTKLDVAKIFSETYTEKLPVKYLGLNVRGLKPGLCAKRAALPYDIMFPELESLLLVCESDDCERHIEISNLTFLTKLKIIGNSTERTVCLSGLEKLQNIYISGNVYLDFNTPFLNLQKISFNYQLDAYLKNLIANPNLIIKYRGVPHVITSEIDNLLKNLGQKYQLHIGVNDYSNYSACSNWNIKSISGLVGPMIFTIHELNRPLLANLKKLSIHRTVDLSYHFLKEMSSLQKVKINVFTKINNSDGRRPSEKVVSTYDDGRTDVRPSERIVSAIHDDMEFIVKIPQVHFVRDNNLIVEMFCIAHEKVSQENPVTICQEITCTTACTKLTAYAKKVGLIYKRN
jgi:hypothetical protein